MAFRLIPREERFFDDFVALAEQIRHGAALLEEMLAPERPIWDKADEIKEVEHKCDFLTHEIIQRLHRTFVTPLDREDIHTLARSLDDVMDAIDASAAIVRLYQIEQRAAGRARARARHQGVARTGGDRAEGPRAPQRRGRAGGRDQPARERGRSRASERACAGSSRRSAIPIAIIKWKEILDFLEDATDRCEDVANVARRRRRQARLSAGWTPTCSRSSALIVVALIFDYINGFHDAANSIATVVSTRVLTPGKAVIWAAFFNFVAAFTFGTAVAKTVGSGLVDISVVSASR